MGRNTGPRWTHLERNREHIHVEMLLVERQSVIVARSEGADRGRLRNAQPERIGGVGHVERLRRQLVGGSPA